MRKRVSPFLSLGLCFLLGSPAAFAAIPDWVRQAASASLPAYDPETNAVVLLDDDEVIITGLDTYVDHYRRVIKILRPDGRKQAELSLYLQQKEKVLSMHAWSIDRTGHEFELKDKDFAERGVFFGFDLYNDIRARSATAPAADAGSVIAFEYEVRRRSWVNQLDWQLQESVPVHRAHIAVQLPVGWEMKTHWAGRAEIAPVEPAPNRWEWTAEDLAAITDEPMRPPLRALSALLGVAYFAPGGNVDQAGSWDALGRWYSQLTAGRRNPSPPVSDKARQLTAGKNDFDGKARAVASFVQSDIRYVEIQIGIGGYQPHLADDIFRFHYGDCKDKVTLLSSMLHEVGIESNYVLINTRRGSVNPKVPSIVFDHAIAAIELPSDARFDAYHSVLTAKTGKRYLIFDPTDPYTPLGELRGELQDTYALLVTDAGGELIHTPLMAPATNSIVRTGHFVLGSDGSLSGQVVETSSGDHAARERAALLRANQQERSQLLERRLSYSLQGFSIASTNIEQLDQFQRDLVVKYQFTAPFYSQIRGSLMLVRPRVIGVKGFALELKPRHYPFQFLDTSKETDTYEIEIPQGYVVDDVPDPVHLDMGFATYQSKVEVVSSTVRYTREFVRQTDFLATDRTDDLRTFLGTIGADESAVVVLKRAP